MRKPALILCLTLLTQTGIAALNEARLADAAKRGDKAAIATLLKDRAEVNKAQADGSTALHWAAYHGDAELVGQLIGAGANINAANELGATPLWLASSRGNLAAVQALLTAKADASKIGRAHV